MDYAHTASWASRLIMARDIFAEIRKPHESGCPRLFANQQDTIVQNMDCTCTKQESK